MDLFGRHAVALCKIDERLPDCDMDELSRALKVFTEKSNLDMIFFRWFGHAASIKTGPVPSLNIRPPLGFVICFYSLMTLFLGLNVLDWYSSHSEASFSGAALDLNAYIIPALMGLSVAVLSITWSKLLAGKCEQFLREYAGETLGS